MKPIEYLMSKLQQLQAEQAQNLYLFPDREDESTREKRVLINEYLKAIDVLKKLKA